MKPDATGFCLIEEVACNSFMDMRAQFVPSIPLCKNIMSQAFSHKTSIGFLRNTEDNLHVLILSFSAARGKLRSCLNGRIRFAAVRGRMQPFMGESRG